VVDDSIPGKKVALVITSPGFGSSSVNSGFIRVSLVQPMKEKNLKKKLQRN
jgi:HAE1 family hydrophobic/amphiphilic exporter-1/multidrug efflux pump